MNIENQISQIKGATIVVKFFSEEGETNFFKLDWDARSMLRQWFDDLDMKEHQDRAHYLGETAEHLDRAAVPENIINFIS